MWYRQGSVSVTNGSATVTGSGTAWIANVEIGEGFLGPDGRIYEIVSVASNTSLTIGQTYLGSTVSGQNYVIVPTQSYIRDLAAQAATLVNSYSNIVNTIGQGKYPDGTVSEPGIRFADDLDTGIYRIGANILGIAAGGTERIRATTTGASVTGTFSATGAANFSALNATPIGGTTRAAGSFTTLDANGNVILGDAATDTISITGRFITDLIPLADNLRDLGTSALKWKQVYATTYTEGTFSVVSQTDIGTAPNQLPLNQYLGNLAFQNSNGVVLNPVASAVPSGIGDMVFQLTSDTSLEIKVKGSDGTVRSVALTLA
jgi:hypothetical protein